MVIGLWDVVCNFKCKSELNFIYFSLYFLEFRIVNCILKMESLFECFLY